MGLAKMSAGIMHLRPAERVAKELVKEIGDVAGWT